MSLTMQHIISDAQTLCTRLKDHESLADRLISQAQSLYKQVDAMKQYEEEVSQLNEVAHQKPRDALVQGIQQENRHLRELQQENKELRNSLEEHQNTLEIVMSNYRKQVTQLMEINKSDREVQRSQSGAVGHNQSSDPSLVELQSDKIREMALVMRRAVELDEQSEHRAQEAIAQLSRENKGLRELLRVAYSYNGDLMPATAAHCSGSPSGSPCSQTIRRRCSADSPSGTDAGFQTVRRRLPAAGNTAEKPADGKTPPVPTSSPPKSPAEGRAPPVPSSAPPKVPALAGRVPSVPAKGPPAVARAAAPAPAPAAPCQPAVPAGGPSPVKSGLQTAGKPATKTQSSPPKEEAAVAAVAADRAGSEPTTAAQVVGKPAAST